MERALTPQERRAAAAARNKQLMPELSALVAEVRETFPKAKLIYGVDHSTGYEVGTKDGHEVHVADMQPRRVK